MRRVRLAGANLCRLCPKMDASGRTTSPGARAASAPDRVPVHDALSPGTRLDEFEILRVPRRRRLRHRSPGAATMRCCARSRSRSTCPRRWPRAAEGVIGVAGAPRALADTFAKRACRVVPQRGPPARAASTTARWSRCTGSGAGERHRLHGDAVLRRPDAEATRAAHGLPPDEAWLRRLSSSRSLDALDAAAPATGVYHRDISPDNILPLDRRPAGPARLRLGAPRHRPTARNRSRPCLKPQLRAASSSTPTSPRGMRARAHGPTCSALGATLYFVLAGRAPTPVGGARQFATRRRRSPRRPGRRSPRVRGRLLGRDHRLDAGWRWRRSSDRRACSRWRRAERGVP